MSTAILVLLVAILLFVWELRNELRSKPSENEDFENDLEQLKSHLEQIETQIAELKEEAKQLATANSVEELADLVEQIGNQIHDTDGEPIQISRYTPSRNHGGLAATDTASDDDLERAVNEAIAEVGAKSGRQMGLVIKAARQKLHGKRFKEQELDSVVHGRFRQ